MSSEDTELTFVRCPSCRSLVPAVATRCRMCGHQFSSQEDSSSAENVSHSTEKPVEKTVVEQPIIEQSTNEPSFTEEKQIENSENSFEHVEKQNSYREKSFNQDSSFNESNAKALSFNNERKAKPLNFGSDPVKPAEREERGFEEPESDANFEKEFKNNSDSNSDRNEATDDPKPKKRKRKRKKKTSENAVKSSNNDNDTSYDNNLDGSRDDRKPSRKKERSHVYENRGATERITKSKSNSTSRDASTGVLVGWLVSYSNDSNGFSVELRTGKFFVAKQKLREDDLIIPDSAISTPHCLIKVSRGSLQVQDLMSENGTFVKKQGSNSYTPSDEVSSVEHGDMLKFGAYELSVCLVPEN